jgi:hypothetical protein
VAGFCEHGDEPLGSIRKRGYIKLQLGWGETAFMCTIFVFSYIGEKILVFFRFPAF